MYVLLKSSVIPNLKNVNIRCSPKFPGLYYFNNDLSNLAIKLCHMLELNYLLFQKFTPCYVMYSLFY